MLLCGVLQLIISAFQNDLGDVYTSSGILMAIEWAQLKLATSVTVHERAWATNALRTLKLPETLLKSGLRLYNYYYFNNKMAH